MSQLGSLSLSDGLTTTVFVTSARYTDPTEGPVILHFAVPASSQGVTVKQDWQALGMRSVGSQNIFMEDVFVPDSAITLTRKAGHWHPVWSAMLGIALPLTMSVYVSVAEAAFEKARAQAMNMTHSSVAYSLGEMSNTLTTAQLALGDMIRLANNYRFVPSVALANNMLTRKTIVSNAVLATTEHALELTGGLGVYTFSSLERFVRDSRAAQFQLLPEKQQQLFTGRLALGLEPVV
ncbi:MAG: acyl-CoA dehydrogenase [Deinococcota bacterium]